uniref:(northern house mosquito) hypothetical protein n=1 Tax=Culex pipiens TaxID=7175 RepID=A0A8D7ZWR9_CULPI
MLITFSLMMNGCISFLLLHFSHCFVCLLPYFLVTIIIAFFSFFVFFCSLCFDSFHLFFLHKFCVLFFHLPELGLGVVIFLVFGMLLFFCFVFVFSQTEKITLHE